MTLEKQLSRLLKEGRISVKGIKAYKDLAAYAQEQGYEVDWGTYSGGRVYTNLIINE